MNNKLGREIYNIQISLIFEYKDSESCFLDNSMGIEFLQPYKTIINEKSRCDKWVLLELQGNKLMSDFTKYIEKIKNIPNLSSYKLVVTIGSASYDEAYLKETQNLKSCIKSLDRMRAKIKNEKQK